MRSKEDDQGLGALLLAFYECLTDPDQLDTLMEMLTSWLDDDERHVVTPKLDTHVEQALKLLGDLSTNKLPATQQNGLLDQDTYDSGPDLEAALRDKLAAEDVFQLHKWITSGTADSALLLRAFEAEATDLIILTFDPELNRYVAKRAGAKYNETIASFMAESFDLTRAELALLGELLGGGTLRDVADRLGKSWETTRSQVKTLTNKMGVSSQADILRMATQAATLMPYPNRSDDVLQMNTLRSIGRPNGRRMCYEIDTPRGWQPGGPTLVYLHGMVEGRHWPERAVITQRHGGGAWCGSAGQDAAHRA